MKHLILMGPPGCGKTLYARRLVDAPGALKHTVACEGDISRLRRAAGFDPPHPVDSDGLPVVPFRAPHHTVSEAGMTGALTRGFAVRPGELSLAHGGVLYLDEVQEFRASVLAGVLRALTTGEVELLGERGTRVVLPAQFRLVLGATPTPCGYPIGHEKCRCTEKQAAAWLRLLEPFYRHCEIIQEPQIRARVKELTGVNAA
jgi:magnesium chelatase family protein